MLYHLLKWYYITIYELRKEMKSRNFEEEWLTDRRIVEKMPGFGEVRVLKAVSGVV